MSVADVCQSNGVSSDPWEKQCNGAGKTHDNGHLKTDGPKTSDNLIKIDGNASVLPADELFTWDKKKPVKIRGNHPSPAVTVMETFLATVEKFGSNLALATKVDGKWKTWTYNEYYDDVVKTAKSLINIGLQPFEGVGIVGFNSPEWFFAYFGAIFAGGLATGIYSTNSPEACKFVAQNAECSVIVVENEVQLEKILKVRSELPRLKAIVQYKGPIKASLSPPSSADDQQNCSVYTWEEFLKLGDSVPLEELNRRIQEQHPNQCCSLIYTSGTVGNPKGVMLSHDNLTWTSSYAGKVVEVKEGSEVIVSYLPLSHVAAQVLDIFIPISFGLSVYFAQPDAMKGSLGETLKEVRPTIFFGVPRVWEKMAEKLTAVIKKSGRVKRTLFQWSMYIGLKGNLAKMNGNESLPYGWTLVQSLVFSKIRLALGLDRCRLCFSAAAPIMKETLEFFTSLDMPLLEIFGMSETTGPHMFSKQSKWRMTSCGFIDPYCSVDISSQNAEKVGEGEEGEVCMDGRNIFMGYLNEPEKTKETFDEKGRLRSGDLGKVDKDGFVYITGRIKELIITAGGENVAPIPIEDAVKESLSPCVSNCMLIGDKQKFLSLLITLKTNVNPDTLEPTDHLAPSVIEWCRSLGSQVSTVTELRASPGDPVHTAIQKGIHKANEKSVSRAQIIQKWSILPRDFSIQGGELGPTLKLKRHFVAQLYQSTIESFYTSDSNH